MHLPSGSPNYIMKSGHWETPFGELAIEARIADTLTKEFPFKIETEKQFAPDNTIELQLPFIKYFFKDIAIIPMGVPPDAASLDIGKRAVTIAKTLGLKVKVIGSTDLTHYGVNYGFMPKGTGKAAVEWVKNDNDRKVIEAMADLLPEKVLESAYLHHNACCAGAVATAISAAKALGAASPAQIVTYTTSYDKSPGDSLVGYVGMVF
jgi:MEMO1 family protein